MVLLNRACVVAMASWISHRRSNKSMRALSEPDTLSRGESQQVRTMSTTLPGRPVQNEAPDKTERFQTSVLLVLGLALIGAASIALGFAGGSAPGVAIGSGVVLGAGAISVFNAIARPLFRFQSSFRAVISRRNSSQASHMPVPTEPTAPAPRAREAETLLQHDTSPVRPRELFQADHLTRHPFVRPSR